MPVNAGKIRPVVERKGHTGVTCDILKQSIVVDSNIHPIKIRHAKIGVVGRIVADLPLDAVCPFGGVIPHVIG